MSWLWQFVKSFFSGVSFGLVYAAKFVFKVFIGVTRLTGRVFSYLFLGIFYYIPRAGVRILRRGFLRVRDWFRGPSWNNFKGGLHFSLIRARMRIQTFRQQSQMLAGLATWWRTWWGARSPHIRWWRSFFYTGVSFAAYGFSIFFLSRAGHTYMPQFIINWLWSGWNWFFWPAIIAFWLEEFIDAGQPEENRWNPWPKKLFGAYLGIIGVSLGMALLAFVTNHEFYVKQLHGQRVTVQEKKAELERELAEAEGITPPESQESGEEKREDEFFKGKSEDEDSFFSSGEEKTSKRSAWKIRWELWKLKAKEKMWGKAVGEDINALWLRFSKALGWLMYAVQWLPCVFLFLLVIIPTYGLEALESRVVRLVWRGGRRP